jgi:tetratricopeptide (TPR) repeat protein
MGVLQRGRGDYDRAIACHTQALRLARAIASAWDEGEALAGLGRCALAVGRIIDAATTMRQAHMIFQQIGAAEASEIAAELVAITQAD